MLEIGPLSDADIDDLARLAKAPHFGDSGITARGPSGSGTGIKGTALPIVSLVELSGISRVNALAPGPVPFHESGLTVVYGDNGSGKSGLVRILKKACRSLAPGEAIRPSIYGEPTGPPPEATIGYAVNGERREVQWRQGDTAIPELQTVNVFDAECARRQVERENRIIYRPAILQVFTDLAAACDRVRAKLDVDLASLGPRDPAVANLLQQLGDTDAGRFVRGLSASSSLELLETLASLSDEEKEELADLRKALQDDPLQRATEVAARARRVTALDSLMRAAAPLLDDAASDEFETLVASARAAAEAAAAVADQFRADSPLEGLGSDAWKELWAAARRFSEAHAYPGETYPVTREGSLCVLCQQPLDVEGKVRLRHFEDFIRSDLQQRAEKLGAELNSRQIALSGIRFPVSSVALSDAGLGRDGLGAEVRRWLILARARRRFLLRRDREAARTRPALPDLPDLNPLKASLEREELQLLGAANEETRRCMIVRMKELSDREALARVKESVAKEIARLQTVARLERAIRDCARTGITRKEGEAAQLVLSGALRAEFAENLAALGLTAPAVEVELGGGQQGERPYRVRLTATGDVRAAEVLSEGEKTCVALAGFLAELTATGNRSGIVLDDPVCSLDHRFRDKVAERLALEARTRQVVVLTHEVVFLWELREHARRHGVEVYFIELERGYREYGRPRVGAPWLGRTAGERVRWLRAAIQEAEAVLRRDGRAAYEEKASYVYKRMRDTWERTVEELLLNRVVERFRPGVETQRLRVVVDIKPEDIDLVDREMRHCSKFVHDEPGARNEGVPDPDVVRDDLARLEAWIAELRERGRRN